MLAENSESQRDSEYVLPPAISEKTTKNHQKEEEPTLHNAHSAVKGQHRRDDPVGTCLLAREGTHN